MGRRSVCRLLSPPWAQLRLGLWLWLQVRFLSLNIRLWCEYLHGEASWRMLLEPVGVPDGSRIRLRGKLNYHMHFNSPADSKGGALELERHGVDWINARGWSSSSTVTECRQARRRRQVLGKSGEGKSQSRAQQQATSAVSGPQMPLSYSSKFDYASESPNMRLKTYRMANPHSQWV